ncbi:hypothetical protein ACLOJK_040340 [Asimina triloba]
MLKGHLKLLEKKNRATDQGQLRHFADGWDFVTLGAESGEELKTFRSCDVRLDEVENQNDYVDRNNEKEEKVSSQKTACMSENQSLYVRWDDKLFGGRKDKEILKTIPTSCSFLDDEEKKAKLECELSHEVINLEVLQKIASSGLPDEGSWRATSWKILLGYLPADRDAWERELSLNRSKYAMLKEEHLLNPSELTRKKEETVSSNGHEREVDADGQLMRHQISQEDHPLSLRKASVWHQYFQDEEIAEQIDRDLQRTHPNVRFFSSDSPLGHKRRKEMRNILLLFAKLNPAIRYVQGMNEVLAPLYYVFSTDPDEQNAPEPSNAEADSFGCFVLLLSDSVDHFCQQLDNSSVGILSTLARLVELVKENDEELWQHLEIVGKSNFTKVTLKANLKSSIMWQITSENQGLETSKLTAAKGMQFKFEGILVNPQFYAFRWITLLLTQEFDMYNIMRIWDSLLSNPFGVQEMLLRDNINIAHFEEPINTNE